MAKVDPYSVGYSIGQMLAYAKGREEKQRAGFANTSANQPQTAEQAIIAAINDRIFGTPFNNMGPPQRDPAVGRPMPPVTRREKNSFYGRGPWTEADKALYERMAPNGQGDYRLASHPDTFAAERKIRSFDENGGLVDDNGDLVDDPDFKKYDEITGRLRELIDSDLDGLGSMANNFGRARRPTAAPVVNATAALPRSTRDARLRNADRVLAQYPGAVTHAAEVKRARDHAAAMDAASASGQRGVREADYYELASKYPEHQQPGAVLVGGGDMSHIPRRLPPQLFRGGVSAAISGLGSPMSETNNKLAEREAGIRAYEQQTGPRAGQSGATRDTIERNRTRNLLEGRGYIPDKRAEYLLQQRENEQTRNKALAAAQQYVQSQPTALMRLEDYRDPQGAFERRMQERAFGLAEQRESGAAADRAEALRMRGEGLGLQREGLGIEREKIASQERLASEGLKRDDARESRKEDLQLRLLEIQERLNNARADRNVNFQRELQTEKINAEKELAEMTAKTRASEADAERKADLLEKFTALPEAEWRKLAPATIAHLAKQGIPVPAQYQPGANEQPRVPLAREQMKPDLEAEWDTISTAEGGGKSSLRDFIMQTPAEDIANNLDDYERA